MEIQNPVPLILDMPNPKSIGFDTLHVEDHYCSKFKIIPITGFRFQSINQSF